MMQASSVISQTLLACAMREGHEEADPKRLDSKGLSSADPKRVNSKGMSSAWKKKQYELTDLVCRGQNIDWTAVLFYTNYGGLDPNHVDKVQMTSSLYLFGLL
ncbi:unnamed protein product [Polarella glacialis]|uniref:Uncharacterized protein n=1 Tax=Polarella glacialis TaxID=89957 RepID=A0A813JFS6_POLGL|nr:unnamed protein product [Polarella glacialis]CAE8698872.1 unnamed protein product [Polarella glacialis]